MTDVLLTHSYHLSHDAKQLRKMQPYPPQPRASTITSFMCNTLLCTSFAHSLRLLRCAPAPVSGFWFHRHISNPGRGTIRSLSALFPESTAYSAIFRSFA
jgi:hypothetical protein